MISVAIGWRRAAAVTSKGARAANIATLRNIAVARTRALGEKRSKERVKQTRLSAKSGNFRCVIRHF